MRAKNAEVIVDDQKVVLVLDLRLNFVMAKDMNERIDAEELSDSQAHASRLLFQETAMLQKMYEVFAKYADLPLQVELILRDRARTTYTVERLSDEVDWLALGRVIQ